MNSEEVVSTWLSNGDLSDQPLDAGLLDEVLRKPQSIEIKGIGWYGGLNRGKCWCWLRCRRIRLLLCLG